MSNADAAAVLAKIDANGTRKALERVSAIVDGITSRTRQIFIDAGLEKPETIEKWNEKYEHYVPLHRDEVGGSAMPRIGQGFNIRGRDHRSEKTKVDQEQTGDLRSTAEVRGYIWGYPLEKKSSDHA